MITKPFPRLFNACFKSISVACVSKSWPCGNVTGTSIGYLCFIMDIISQWGAKPCMNTLNISTTSFALPLLPRSFGLLNFYMGRSTLARREQKIIPWRPPAEGKGCALLRAASLGGAGLPPRRCGEGKAVLVRERGLWQCPPAEAPLPAAQERPCVGRELLPGGPGVGGSTRAPAAAPLLPSSPDPSPPRWVPGKGQERRRVAGPLPASLATGRPPCREGRGAGGRRGERRWAAAGRRLALGEGWRVHIKVFASCKPKFLRCRLKGCEVEGEGLLPGGSRWRLPLGELLALLNWKFWDFFRVSSAGAPPASGEEVSVWQAASGRERGAGPAVPQQLLGERDGAFVQNTAALPGINTVTDAGRWSNFPEGRWGRVPRGGGGGRERPAARGEAPGGRGHRLPAARPAPALPFPWAGRIKQEKTAIHLP